MPEDASNGTLKFRDDDGKIITCTLANIPGSNPDRTYFIVLPDKICSYGIKRTALGRISVHWDDFLEGHKPPRNTK